MANKYDQMIQILSFNQQNEKLRIFIKAGARKQNSISDKIKRSSWKINQEKMNVDFVVRNIRNFNSYNKNNEKGYRWKPEKANNQYMLNLHNTGNDQLDNKGCETWNKKTLRSQKTQVLLDGLRWKVTYFGESFEMPISMLT